MAGIFECNTEILCSINRVAIPKRAYITFRHVTLWCVCACINTIILVALWWVHTYVVFLRLYIVRNAYILAYRKIPDKMVFLLRYKFTSKLTIVMTHLCIRTDWRRSAEQLCYLLQLRIPANTETALRLLEVRKQRMPLHRGSREHVTEAVFPCYWPPCDVACPTERHELGTR